ncbi:hypothetical protein REPUB_Repub07fG0105800 [Reevesia pubescens]
MFSETSPRVSFSHDLGQADHLPIELDESRRDSILSESCSDFEFNICSSRFDQESSSADELFANGMILPFRFQEKQVQKCELAALVSLPLRPKLSIPEDSKKESMRQIMPVNADFEEKPQSNSFWGFKRSSSLNCDIKKSLICSLPLLSRSNSTGSVPNPKRSSIKDRNKHSSQKLSSISTTKSSSSSSSCCSSYNAYQFPQKPPLKKNHGNSYGNGVRISPVLNVPPPYISKGTANLFGLGSFLRNGKDKKSRK